MLPYIEHPILDLGFYELEDRGELVKTIGEIERRFEGMESMIVEYPVGSENTLEAAAGLLQQMRYRL